MKIKLLTHNTLFTNRFGVYDRNPWVSVKSQIKIKRIQTLQNIGLGKQTSAF